MKVSQDKPTTIEVSEEVEPLQIPSLNVFGQVLGRVAVVSYTDSSLLTSVGRVGDDESGEQLLLVPFIEMKFETASLESEASAPIFEQILTMDNAAYLLADVCNDFSAISGQLAKMSQGSIGPEPVRMMHTRRFLSDARDSLDRCLAELDKIKKV